MAHPPSPPARPARDEPREIEARRRRLALEERDADGALSEAEAAAVADWRRFEEAARRLTGRARERSSFAAALLRYAGDGSVWLGFAEDPDAALAAVLGDFPWPERARAYRAPRSSKALMALRQAIEARRGELAGHGVTVNGLGVDEEANVVRVMVAPEAVDRVVRELREFGDAVRVEGGWVMRADAGTAPRRERPRPGG